MQEPPTDKQDAEPITSTRAPIPKTRGLRKSSVAIVVACVGLVILFALMEVFQQADPGRRSGEDEAKSAPSKNVTPDSIMDLPSDYSKIPGPEDAPIVIKVGPDGRDTIRKDAQGRPLDENGRPILSTREQMRVRALEDQKRYEDDLQREIRRSQLREREKAFASAIFFPPSTSAQPGAQGGAQMPGNNNTDLIDALKAQAEQPPINPNEVIPQNVRQNLQTEKILFSSSQKDQEPYVQNPFLKPISPYVVQAGTVIPGALLTAINTDLPGECMAVVTRNVYDTPTGDHLLVPAGARLIGVYNSLVSNGQNRAQIAWNRLLMPNGRSILLGNMPATDKKGQAGLQDLVDYHWDRITLAVGITTGLAYAGNLARDQDNPNSDRDFIGDTVAQESARVGQKIVERELDVQPTITIRSGWPLRLMVNKDLVLEPYIQ